MKANGRSHSLHGRITVILLGTAIVTTVLYVVFVVTIVHRMEDAMLTTLVGHELDEMISELTKNPDAPMPQTLSIKGFMPDRDGRDSVPPYLLELPLGIHRDLEILDKNLMVAVVEIPGQTLILEFDVSGIQQNQNLLIITLVSGGLAAAIVLIISGIWLTRKFLVPISQLAEELTHINPDTRDVRIKDKFKDNEVGIIAESIDEYLARLDEFVEREQSFTAAVSHELRTPVAIVLTSTDLLELKGIGDHQKKEVDKIKSSTVYMGKVIESLLLFVRKTQSEIDETMPEIELKSVFKNTVRQHRQAAADKGVKLTLDCHYPARVRMSESHVEIILSNLLRNAITNTSNGDIRVVLEDTYFSVSDTGKGISADDVQKIVKFCYRDESSPGYGVGLYLVTNICRYYGLELDIDSLPDQGSCFKVRFSDKIMSSAA